MAHDPSRRLTLTALAAAAAAVPAAAQKQQQNPQHKHDGMVSIAPPPVYKAKFFTAAEFETLADLVDLIIPRTDTPGAKDAGVHRIIDSGVKPADRKAWRDGLRWLEAEARGRHAGRFLTLAGAQKVALLERAAGESDTRGARFFRLLKDASIDAYYSTREGLAIELGWRGNTFLPAFTGCTHPEHQG